MMGKLRENNKYGEDRRKGGGCTCEKGKEFKPKFNKFKK